ncbi:MAG: HlyD family efflux transporter periplasmic adaptor subunit [Salegentibacter sp.]
MKQKIIFTIINIVALGLVSCGNGDEKADGYGNFEATEVVVSAENNGKIMAFEVEEGQQIPQNKMLGYIDTIPLSLKKEQLQASRETISSRSRSVLSQIDVLQAQLKTANINKDRIEKMLKDNAATQKQLDDINGEISVLRQKMQSVKQQNAPVISEVQALDIQVKQLEDQIEKSKIINPVKGTVLVKYAEPMEVASFGKPLYKIANLDTMELRVYVSEPQLSEIKTGEEVMVKIDAPGGMKSYKGIISWIASEAEFTPKIIQTKEERVDLVYAVKVEVKNDGSLKIGMPAEMWLSEEKE